MATEEAVLGVRGGGIVSAEMTYDEAHIEKRSRAIAYAIDARRQKYPDEAPSCTNLSPVGTSSGIRPPAKRYTTIA